MLCMSHFKISVFDAHLEHEEYLWPFFLVDMICHLRQRAVCVRLLICLCWNMVDLSILAAALDPAPAPLSCPALL